MQKEIRVNVFNGSAFVGSGFIVEDGGVNSMGRSGTGGHFSQYLVRLDDGRHQWVNYCNVRIPITDKEIVEEVVKIGREIQKSVQELYKVVGI